MTDSDSDASFLGDAEDLYMDLDFEEDAPDLEQEAKLKPTPEDPLPVYLQESNDSAPSKRKTFGEPTPKVSSAEIKRRRMAMPFTDKIGESRLENKAVEAIAELVKSKKWSTPAPGA
ncbi:hypothetical protein HKX48_004221 [Thoreauomyces humboldtii]|nr:hypothetical protein HKX48_004221 [Thoreauomyces humboldtii]